MKRALTVSIYGLSSLIGLVAFLYPFFRPVIQSSVGGTGHQQDAPILTFALISLCLIALLLDLQGQAVSAKMVAVLGILIAITSVLRFLESAIPGPGGFSPIFAPIILAGYVFGWRFGFLMGSLTLAVSGLITGGVGPWLPFQMFTAGWIGMGAGWLPNLADRRAIIMLAIYGLLTGMLFGAVMNLYFWPFVSGDAATSWQYGSTLAETLTSYGAFYALTSLVWDILRGTGNFAFILILGAPTLRALRRFQRRFQFTYSEAPHAS